MNPNVKKQFDAVATQYEEQRRGLIPCFDDFYGMALSLAESGERSPRVLDLGAGTGLMAAMVRSKLPAARMTLIDMSESMLDVARERFSGDPHVEIIVADYSDYAFAPESFDIIVSSLSIHHLTHASKQELFKKLYRALSPGGVFVNADQVAGHTPASDAYYRRRWLAEIAASGLSQSAIDASVERRSVDINAKLDDQLAWMTEAGFQDADCMYKYLDFAVFFGAKPAAS
ncbi:class I SAM-dependent methyltransferase [Cohnella hashimotonis]|uniref:Methyltransferase domain-containing protein n=1 Tax=Cohnella hashimotonis TaxID=2826895 RepID=A0ABT6TT91_9BACL|nr:class I SAM-dependent methyltransferase [Cohnella hashimotonis]MDI4650030.1 methyltransferase domain-containing protein [Cohnella hashimotonis]